MNSSHVPTQSTTAASGTVSLYAGVARQLTRYALDVQAATLTRQESIQLPQGIQYATTDPARRVMYVVSSDGKPRDHGTEHFVSAYLIDPVSGKLEPLGAAAPLPWRPIHISCDRQGEHVFIVHVPTRLTVLKLRPDGSLGPAVAQPADLDLGNVGHQILPSPSGRHVIIPARGNNATATTPEDPGSLKVFDYRDGRFSNRRSVEPGQGGYGFGPRHLAFHLTRPWLYVSMERENQLAMFHMQDEVPDFEPAWRKTTLLEPDRPKPRQLVGTVHLHPDGRSAYVANRADGTEDDSGQQVFNGGENTITVFALDQATGEPNRIQTMDTHGLHTRTFTIDPLGKLLVAANMLGRAVRGPNGIEQVSACLSVFRIGADGTLAYASKIDVDTGKDTIFWAGIVGRP